MFTGVSTDSRTLHQGDLFVALSGDRFDGHRFVDAAQRQGAVAAMVKLEFDETALATEFPLMRVSNTQLSGAARGLLAKTFYPAAGGCYRQ